MNAVTYIIPSIATDFTAQEVAAVRGALHFLHLRSGRWATLGRVLRIPGSTLGNVANGHRPLSAKLVLRIARFAGLGLDDVLAGKFPAPGTCPHCGHCAAALESDAVQ
jgi:hypothetical protein